MDELVPNAMKKHFSAEQPACNCSSNVTGRPSGAGQAIAAKAVYLGVLTSAISEV